MGLTHFFEETRMNRRTFAQSFAVAAVAATVPEFSAGAAGGAVARTLPPFPLSVMLWAVFTDQPFEERLAKVAEAGYSNVELVGEYAKWSEADFVRANAARKRLGIRIDATAGLPHGVAEPANSDAFLADLKQALVPMETLEIPAMIALSGNVVPGLAREAQHACAVETLKRAAAMVEGKQIDGQPVRLLLECIDFEENPHYFLQSALEGMEIVRQVNHPQVQFLYDIFHEQIVEGNLIEKLEKNIDVVGLIHVADVPGRHEPGTGEINYSSIYRKLVQLHYKHVVAMEFKPTGDSVAALRMAKAMALNAGAV
jgi:hydroxypyruvate isomerase